MAASSSAVPWAFGTLNQSRSFNNQYHPEDPRTTRVAAWAWPKMPCFTVKTARFAHIVVDFQFAGISAGSSGVPTSGSSRVLTGPLNDRLAPDSHPIQTPSARAMVTTGA